MYITNCKNSEYVLRGMCNWNQPSCPCSFLHALRLRAVHCMCSRSACVTITSCGILRAVVACNPSVRPWVFAFAIGHRASFHVTRLLAGRALRSKTFLFVFFLYFLSVQKLIRDWVILAANVSQKLQYRLYRCVDVGGSASCDFLKSSLLEVRNMLPTFPRPLLFYPKYCAWWRVMGTVTLDCMLWNHLQCFDLR